MPDPQMIAAGVDAGASIANKLYDLITKIRDRNERNRIKQGLYNPNKSSNSGPGALNNLGYRPTGEGLPENAGLYTTFSPQQQAALNQVLNYGSEGLGTENREQRALEQFRNDVIPSIMERFQGANNSDKLSGGVFNALAQAGRGITSDLAAQRESNATNLLRLGLTPQYQEYLGAGGGDQNLMKTFIRDFIQGGGGGKAADFLTNYLRNRNERGELSQLESNNAAAQGLSNINNNSYFSPSFNAMNSLGMTQGLTPTSSYGSMQAMANPGNLVSGIQSPQGIGLPQGFQVKPNGKMSNFQALKGLYGL